MTIATESHSRHFLKELLAFVGVVSPQFERKVDAFWHRLAFLYIGHRLDDIHEVREPTGETDVVITKGLYEVTDSRFDIELNPTLMEIANLDVDDEFFSVDLADELERTLGAVHDSFLELRYVLDKLEDVVFRMMLLAFQYLEERSRLVKFILC
jgi:hypothetical protein